MLRRQKIKDSFSFLSVLMATFIFLLSVNAHGYEKETLSINNAQHVKFKARPDEDFLLHADYYAGDKKSGGVIVLHDCKSDRSRYSKMAKGLFQQGLHTLALDLRGYGGSVSPKYSRDIIKQNATDIVGYHSEMALLTTYWQDDLIAAYQFLRSKVDSNQGIAIVTNGCSAAYGIALADKILLNAIVMNTPQIAYADKERYKNLIDIPSYFITSSHHSDSYQAAQELFSWNGSIKSKMQIFKGDRYNYHLIGRQKSLINDIAYWVDLNVSK
jgi:dienelactone hydrolase